MRWLPSTPCRSFSTAASRRNRGPAAGARRLAWSAGLWFLLLASAPPAGGQGIELSVSPHSGLLTASLEFRWPRPQEVIDALRKGLESRITFTTRVYERRSPAFSFAGDRLILERTVARSAYWDFLDRVFIVEQDGVAPQSYADPQRLVQGFLSLEEPFGFDAAEAAKRRLYVTARAQFEPVRLMPPLTLVGLAGAASTVTTPWVRRDAQ